MHTKKRASHEKNSSSRITEICPFFWPSAVAPTAVGSPKQKKSNISFNASDERQHLIAVKGTLLTLCAAAEDRNKDPLY